MIFEQALRRELSMTTGAVFLVLVTIMITTLVIRILGFAANGVVNPEDALVLIALATLGYFAILLTVSLFIAVLIVSWSGSSWKTNQGIAISILFSAKNCSRV